MPPLLGIWKPYLKQAMAVPSPAAAKAASPAYGLRTGAAFITMIGIILRSHGVVKCPRQGVVLWI